MDVEKRLGDYDRGSYEMKLMRLRFTSHAQTMSWLRQELNAAMADDNDGRQGRRLLHLTDLPIDLWEGNSDSQAVEDLKAFQEVALAQYQTWMDRTA